MEKIKKNYLNIIYSIVYLSLGVWFVIYTFNWFKDLKGFESKTFSVMFILLILLMIITVCILLKINTKSVAKQFLVIALIWGSAFAIVNPPYYVPDESVHVYRSYDLAKGRVFFRGSEDSMMLPKGIIDHDSAIWRDAVPGGFKGYLNDMNIPINKDELIEYNASPTTAYNTIAYIPQAIGVFIGDLLNLPTHFILVLGRLSNLFAWTLLCYLALKLMPIKKELLFMIMFMPIGIQQAASFSPDALLNSSSFLLVSFILYLKFEKESVNYKDYLIISGLTVIIGAIKLPYIVIAGLVILIPNKKMRFSFFSKVLAIIMVLAINLGVVVGWQKLSKPIVKETLPITEVSYDGEDLYESVEVVKDEKEKLTTADVIRNVINEPKIFIQKVGTTLGDQAEFYKYSMTTNFGWFKLLGPEKFMSALILIIFLFALKGDKSNYKLNWFDKTIFVLMTIGMYLVLCLVSLQWQQVPLSEVTIFGGIQGRYFFPFIIGILMIFQNTKLNLKISDFWQNAFRNLYVSWIMTFSLILIFNGYFIYR